MSLEEIQRLFYQFPLTVLLGAELSALAAGYAMVFGGRLFITASGERYLQSIEGGS